MFHRKRAWHTLDCMGLPLAWPPSNGPLPHALCLLGACGGVIVAVVFVLRRFLFRVVKDRKGRISLQPWFTPTD